jgi:hypothetical protein
MDQSGQRSGKEGEKEEKASCWKRIPRKIYQQGNTDHGKINKQKKVSTSALDLGFWI